MRKLLVLFVLAALVLAMLPVSVTAAAPLAELTDLARYFPDTTPIFFAMRTDDAFIEELDALLVRVVERLPGGENLGTTTPLADWFDQFAGQIPGGGGDFGEVFRPWLGDTLAVGVPSMDNLMRFTTGELGPVLVAVAVTDAEALRAQITATLDEADVEYDEAEGADSMTIQFEYNRRDLFLMLREDVLFVASDQSLFPADAPDPVENSIADNEQFATVTGMLPEGDYSALLYLDTAQITALAMEFSAASAPGGVEMPDMSAYAQAVGAQAMGFTILDGGTFVMDMAQTLGDTSALEEMGLPVGQMITTPLDPAFAANIPADATLVMQGTELGATTLAGFEALQVMGEMIEQQQAAMAELYEEQYGLTPDQNPMSNIGAGDIVTFINLAFSGLTGLNLEEDVLPWMTGDYAAYMRVLPIETPPEFTLDAVLVTETSDSAAASELVEAIAAGAEQYDAEFSREDIGGVSALVLPDVIRLLLPEDTPDETRASPELDFILGATDQTFVMGSRVGVEYSLAPAGDSLADSAAFVAAQGYMLENSSVFAFADIQGLIASVEHLIPTQDQNDLPLLAQVFSSASVSGAVSEDGSSISRFVLSLAE